MNCIAAAKGATGCFQFHLETCAAPVLRSGDYLDSRCFNADARVKKQVNVDTDARKRKCVCIHVFSLPLHLCLPFKCEQVLRQLGTKRENCTVILVLSDFKSDYTNICSEL